MEPLRGLNVPCDLQLIEERWVTNFPDGPAAASTASLPPQHAQRGWGGIRQDLTRLGIIETKKDARIDMPDLYRVGFGLGRSPPVTCSLQPLDAPLRPEKDGSTQVTCGVSVVAPQAWAFAVTRRHSTV